MLTNHAKLNLIDANLASTGVFLEVNWDPKDDKTNECKIIKMTLPGGSTRFIDRKILLELIWYFGTFDDKKRSIPQTLETIHHYKTVLGIKANKDIHKNEMINFPIELSVPCSALRQDVIGQLPKEYKNGKINNGTPLVK